MTVVAPMVQGDLLPRMREGSLQVLWASAVGRQRWGCPCSLGLRSALCKPQAEGVWWALGRSSVPGSRGTSCGDLHRVPCQPRHVSSPSLRGSMTAVL